ncbi:metallophosphoesterase [Aureitalea marina]|uniref:Phosphoesterase n=1 Tax=Aureitalea marina TaxID=930804 RepID=A0A2S7KNM8_9FLAO|nr:metallophosphoesterase [Aureitalea marina]PQB04221.1 phosphoesterase [Aureitalea marina]
MLKIYRLSVYILLIVLITGCATYKSKYSDIRSVPSSGSDQLQLDKRIYLIGDAGYATEQQASDGVQLMKDYLSGQQTEDDYLLFLGDNIYRQGMPSKSHKNRSQAETRIDYQIDLAKSFKGQSYFIPGNHDWYSEGLAGLKRQEEYVEKAMGDKDVFQPENGCPYERIDLSDDIVLLAIDTQWYLADWDKHPTMNDDCEINTREQFFVEISGELKKHNEKTIIMAMHHPAFTYGEHGGFFNAYKHLFPLNQPIPLPGLGSIVAQVRSQGGVSSQDRYNVRYDELMDRLVTMSRDSDRVIFVSGHEHSLQYIESLGVKQIVSGSGSKRSAVALGPGAQYVTGDQGFAVLDIYTDGSSLVRFHTFDSGTENLEFTAEVYAPREQYDVSRLPDTFPNEIEATVYDTEETEKSKAYVKAWGSHYRYIYGTKLKVPVATLDTLYGGLTIERKGGGFQTRSLRVQDAEGRNYAIRAVKKSAVQFLQSAAFKDTYVKDEFRDTFTEDLILDLYTATHPFGTFAVAGMADAVGVYHANPYLFYMPKHKALGHFNTEFGDELYFIEERPDDGFLDVASFGEPDDIESTDDVRKKLRSDEKYRVDKQAYIRARMFDMVLGDWDRHQDQWRWARFDISKDESIYRPIPRDRDQVFANYDGSIADLAKALIPLTRKFTEYSDNVKDVKWINLGGIKLDRTFVQTAVRDDWVKEAEHIQQTLTDQVIEEAFTNLPVELQDETTERIKAILKQRRAQLPDMASRYYDRLAKLVIMTATDKDDHIKIIRNDRSTRVEISRIKGGEVQPAYKVRDISRDETSEIWIYALDDDDEISAVGGGDRPIFTRVIGGQNNDIYRIEDGRKIKVFDHKSKPNTIEQPGNAKFRLTDIYSNNLYDYTKYIDRTNNIIPLIGFNPDEGFQLGVVDVFTIKGFKNEPFHRQHRLRAGYYFATNGFDIEYNGEFTNALGRWNFLVNAHITSENFTRNFFGFGNNTENMDDEEGLDFNRVKTAATDLRVGLAHNGFYGSRFEATVAFYRVEVDDTPGRFTTDFFEDMPEVFDKNAFANLDLNYVFESVDNPGTPTRGMYFRLKGGVTTNLENSNTYGYIHPGLQFFNALTRERKLVLRTAVQGQFNLGSDYEFYQAAVLGAQTGLRGFRNQRFAGDSSLAFSGDLRYNLTRFKTGLLPLELGIFGGGDVGRVWLDGEDSSKWHNDLGGGFWVNAVNTLSAQLGLFGSSEGLRVTFGVGASL